MNNGKPTLLIDADDTLWHNNIYYDKAINDFTSMMENNGFSKDLIESRLRCREIENVKHHGYGSYCFALSMRQVYEELCRENNLEIDKTIIEHIESAKDLTCNYPIDLLEGVKETLPLLADKCQLVIFTKGESEEQLAKIERSGISRYFDFFLVVDEKNEEKYRQILDMFNLEPEKTWMIGNSPRSDINPAKAVGMKTILIPYHATWEYEIVNINKDGHETIVLEDFSKLSGLFTCP
jgi:putative hydrolase of the HAD superfamily